MKVLEQLLSDHHKDWSGQVKMATDLYSSQYLFAYLLVYNLKDARYWLLKHMC
jgi:hypothetical protein